MKFDWNEFWYDTKENLFMTFIMIGGFACMCNPFGIISLGNLIIGNFGNHPVLMISWYIVYSIAGFSFYFYNLFGKYFKRRNQNED
jgi:hypothetical protein